MVSPRKHDTPAECKPVAYDKSIYLQDDGTYLLVIREDDKTMNIPTKTLEEAQATADMLPSDGGHDDCGGPSRSVFNPTTKGM